MDDEQLINTLDDSKKISTKTEESVRGAEETTKEIDTAREAYRPVATRGSILYFVVADFGRCAASRGHCLLRMLSAFSWRCTCTRDNLTACLSDLT